MDGKTFEALAKDLLAQCEATMFSKAQEYATEDRLHNFRQPTSMLEVSPAEICLCYQMKHIASVTKIAKEMSAGTLPTENMLREKCQDIINYTLLFYAIAMEGIQNEAIKELKTEKAVEKPVKAKRGRPRKTAKVAKKTAKASAKTTTKTTKARRGRPPKSEKTTKAVKESPLHIPVSTPEEVPATDAVDVLEGLFAQA